MDFCCWLCSFNSLWKRQRFRFSRTSTKMARACVCALSLHEEEEESVAELTRRLLCSRSLCRSATSRSCFLWASSNCRRSKRRACQRRKHCPFCRLVQRSNRPTWLPRLLRRRLDGDATEPSRSTCCFCCCHMRPCVWLEMSRCGNSSRSKGRSSFSLTFTVEEMDGRGDINGQERGASQFGRPSKMNEGR